MLREQAHVASAVRWFTSLLELPGTTLTIVTTEREARERDLLVQRLLGRHAGAISARQFPQLSPTSLRELNAARRRAPGGVLRRPEVESILGRVRLTCDVVAAQMAAPQYEGLRIRHVHYPGQGRKAAQVNYAVAQLDGAAGDYVAVYDVDSRPTVTLLRQTVEWIDRRSRAGGSPPAVVQQSARFWISEDPGAGWQRSICRGAARLQTLWTLRREIPSLRRYGWATRHRTGLAPLDALARGLAQTVGHGLLVRLDVYREVGGLPEFSVLDDLPFGYRLTVEGVPVDVLPFTTTAAAPDRITDLVATQARWFGSYLDYLACMRAARDGGHGGAADRIAALGVGIYRGAAWLMASPVTATCAVLVAGRSPAVVRAVAGAGLWLGCVTPVRMLAAAEGRTPGIAEQTRDSAGLLAAYLLTSIGPVTALVRAATHGLPTDFAPKTHHRSAPKETTS
ncbi:glycosyltransferase family 2 protein [Solwaraspora sp. WMMD1047]|uniref:glycosyltransferase family 2 protein n=1 Tax=Solwaraspora sp. WMMD1047 TaxID=3016102 RepID=UPI002417DCF0|nr:glycosyltransferase family 2 protein [Solwaraspora sp. WMMD1047]MDG4834867.1 glycosyltransferase family 2 protein [Solwaraspora sp. WMMD1047]